VFSDSSAVRRIRYRAEWATVPFHFFGFLSPLFDFPGRRRAYTR